MVGTGMYLLGGNSWRRSVISKGIGGSYHSSVRTIMYASGLSAADEAAVETAAKSIPVVYASNFSAGVNLVLALAEHSWGTGTIDPARLMGATAATPRAAAGNERPSPDARPCPPEDQILRR